MRLLSADSPLSPDDPPTTGGYLVLSRGDDDELLAMPRRRGADGRLPAMDLPVRQEQLSPAEAAARAADDGVAVVAPVMPLALVAPVASSTTALTPAETEAGSDGAGSAWGVAAVGAAASGCTGRGVRVAVLDTGIDRTHPAFAGVELVTENFTEEVDDDIHGHGTHCAGTIFGRPVGGLRIGVAPGVETALIAKVLGVGGATTATLVRAIQWAVERRADVISLSLGFDFPGLVRDHERRGMAPASAVSLALEGYRANVELFGRLLALLDLGPDPTRGTALVVAATGNESDRRRRPPQLVGVAPPAGADGVLAVGAVARSAAGYRIAPFSNTRPRLVAPGVGVVSARAGGGLTAMDGTSMATPHVAGVAALWAERQREGDGTLDVDLLRSQLTATASLNGFEPGTDRIDVGLGLVRAPQ